MWGGGGGVLLRAMLLCYAIPKVPTGGREGQFFLEEFLPKWLFSSGSIGLKYGVST